MISFVMVCSLVLVILFELLSRSENFRNIQVSFRADPLLAEPGEEIVLHYSLVNSGWLPLLCACFYLRFDPGVELCGQELPKSVQTKQSLFGAQVRHPLYLFPHRSVQGRIRVKLPRRGVYELGHYLLETGDYFGLHPVFSSGKTGIKVIVTARRCDCEALEPRGGYLGSISERRFICDDPCMLKGYREYTGLEPMKMISWMQSAKTGQLIVRQNDFTVEQKACVLVNMDPAPPDELEHRLELLRTICDDLEARHIPYALDSNGDLLSLAEGLGRNHVFFIQRRIGVSTLTRFIPFSSLLEDRIRCSRGERNNRSLILITPALSAGELSMLRKLDQGNRPPILVFTEGREERDEKNARVSSDG